MSRLFYSSLMCTSPKLWLLPPVSLTAVIGPPHLFFIPAFPISLTASTLSETGKYKCFNLYLNNSTACRQKNHGNPFNKYRFHKRNSVGVLMHPTPCAHVLYKQKFHKSCKIIFGWSKNCCRSAVLINNDSRIVALLIYVWHQKVWFKEKSQVVLLLFLLLLGKHSYHE